MKSIEFPILKNPSEDDVSKLLAQAGPAGLRGIEEYSPGITFAIKTVDDWFSRKHCPTVEIGIRLGVLRQRLKRLKRERERLMAQGKMRPERLP